MSTIIGSLRYRVTLQSRQRTPDDGGTATAAWSDIATVYAQIVPVSGHLVVAADGPRGRVTHEVLVRAGLDIAPDMRFLEGVRILRIHAVLDVDGRKRWLKCLCEERLP